MQIKGEVFITGDLLKDAAHPGIQPCPLCEAGVCQGGPNDGLSCTPGDSAENAAFPTDPPGPGAVTYPGVGSSYREQQSAQAMRLASAR